MKIAYQRGLFVHDLFATKCFRIDSRYDGYLVEESPCGTQKNVYLLVYEKASGCFTQVIEAAYRYGYEGSMGDKESYVLDLDDDDDRDIVIMEYILSITENEVNGRPGKIEEEF